MARKTSIDTYNEIRANGLLSKRRLEIYNVLFHHGPLTANETFRQLYENNLGPENAASNSAARFSELRDAGVIEEVGEKICEVTGRTVIQWDVTSNLPVKLEKKITPKELKKALVGKIISLGKTIDPKWKQPLREIYAIANSI